MIFTPSSLAISCTQVSCPIVPFGNGKIISFNFLSNAVKAPTIKASVLPIPHLNCYKADIP